MSHISLTSLTGLRKLLPNRPVSYREAMIIAECQACRLAAASGQLTGSVEAHDLLKLTPITLEAADPSDNDRHSGSSTYRHGRWVIRLNTLESSARQRFTLAHELKHIIDATNTQAYENLTERQIERVCDYFAASLLMSKLAVFRLWGDGIQTPEALAKAMRVSPAATIVRLKKLGLPVRSQRTTARQPRNRALGSTAVADISMPPEPLQPSESLGVTS